MRSGLHAASAGQNRDRRWPSIGAHDTGRMIPDDPSTLDDARLVARIAAGDEGAVGIAYDRHSGLPLGSGARLPGSGPRLRGSRERGAEVVQAAFVPLWRRARLFDARSGSLLTWLLAIARHPATHRPPAEGRPPPTGAGR